MNGQVCIDPKKKYFKGCLGGESAIMIKFDKLIAPVTVLTFLVLLLF
jgi:hypothetical protein